MTRGFAVIDLETTGLFPERHDRIVEIAVVHVSPDGIVEDAWETLVNPYRDLGAQHIHGISASAAAQAPGFEAVAPGLAALLRGRVPVAHNASFDGRFLRHALGELGLACPEPEYWLCTMRLAGAFTPGRRSLADCCDAVGHELENAHRASADALAAAALLGAYINADHDRAWWEAWLRSAGDAEIPPLAPVGWVPREDAQAVPRSLLERLPVAVSAQADDRALNLDYLSLLDTVLLDRHMSFRESDDLLRLAQSLGIAAPAAARMHRAYFDGLVAAAWADGDLSDVEWDDIQKIGGALEIEREVIEAALSGSAGEAAPLSNGFVLSLGDVIVITGDTKRPRSEWFQILTERGFSPKESMVKTAKILVAADPDSMSGKARSARQYRVPIVNEEGLERLLGFAR